MKVELDAFDPNDQQLLPNSDELDPLCGWARWGCWYLSLPMLEEDVTAGKQGALNEALRLIALHQIAPPPWLASAMLKEIEVVPRANAVTIEKVLAVAKEVDRLKADAAKAGTKLNLEEIAQDLGMSDAKLDRWISLYRDHVARLNHLAGRLP